MAAGGEDRPDLRVTVTPLQLLHHQMSEVGLRQALLRTARGKRCVTFVYMTVFGNTVPDSDVLAHAWNSRLMGM
jgi:hypothetical protein